MGRAESGASQRTESAQSGAPSSPSFSIREKTPGSALDSSARQRQPSLPGAALPHSTPAFPAQAARIPATHSTTDASSTVTPSTAQEGLQNQPQRRQSGSTLASPTGLGTAPTWPLDELGHLHISGAEPRIFPGVVSRTARRGSVRQGSSSEKDDDSGPASMRSGLAKLPSREK